MNTKQAKEYLSRSATNLVVIETPCVNSGGEVTFAIATGTGKHFRELLKVNAPTSHYSYVEHSCFAQSVCEILREALETKEQS